MEIEMRKATIRIRRNTDAALRKMGQRFAKVWKTGKSTGDELEFESPAALFRVLTPKRWELVERLQKLGPSSFRGLARELERDVKRVHEDVGALAECGLVERTAEGKIHVPYDVIRTEFDLRAVA
jgi:predicted transcriptional regulator